MNAQTYQRVKSVFLSALEREDDRGSYLDEACGDDRTVRLHVERLLSAHHSPCAPFATRDGAGIRREPATLPESVGPYRILGLLGEGGMGTVYRAEQPLPRRQVALKVIRPGLLSSETTRRFFEEIQTLGSLRHPGIATIYEAGLGDKQQPYFAMELVEGRPVLRHARDQNLDLRARAGLLARIAESLQHAHDRGVIHRDLKPGNILVEPSGQPKILDFGIAVLAGHQPGRHAVGTPPYMSPEQLEGNPLDHRSDLYALGVIADRLFAEAPGAGRRQARLRTRLARLADQLLEPDRERRPANAADVVRRLETLAAAPRPGSRRRAALANLAIVLLLTGGAAGGFAFWRAPSAVPAATGPQRPNLTAMLLPGESADAVWEPATDPEGLRRLIDRYQNILAGADLDLDPFPYRIEIIRALAAMRDLPAAEAAARQTLSLALDKEGSGPRLNAVLCLSTVLLEQGRAAEAVEVLHDIDGRRGRGGGRDTVLIGRFLAAQARALRACNRTEEARDFFVRAEALLDRLIENDHPLLIQTRKDLACLPPPVR